MLPGAPGFSGLGEDFVLKLNKNLKLSPPNLKFTDENVKLCNIVCRFLRLDGQLSPLQYGVSVDNSLPPLDIKKSLQQLVILAVALVVLLGTIVGAIWLGTLYVQLRDPYVQLVLSETGNLQQGNAIFQINCAGCHGIYGDGLVGPSLHGVADRKSQLTLIHQVISGSTPPMPQFQPNPQEMADLLAYLTSL